MKTLVLAMSLAFLAGCNQTQPTPAVASRAAEPSSPPPAAWVISKDRNALSGEENVVAVTGGGRRDVSLIIRQRGNKLDCYVTTGEFLETVDNMHDRRSIVKYRFDDGQIVRQAWTISDNNTALFYPGNPRPFIQKIRQAKRLVIEYSPADVVPQTATFDISSLPPDIGR